MYPNLHHAPYEDIISLEEATNIVTEYSPYFREYSFVGRWGTIWVMIALGGLLRLVGTLSLTLAPDSRSSSLSSLSPSV